MLLRPQSFIKLLAAFVLLTAMIVAPVVNSILHDPAQILAEQDHGAWHAEKHATSQPSDHHSHHNSVDHDHAGKGLLMQASNNIAVSSDRPKATLQITLSPSEVKRLTRPPRIL